MLRNIIVLFSSPSVRGEAVQYSIELAKRTDCGLVFLLILPFENGEKALAGNDRYKNMETRVAEALARPMNSAKEAGVPAEAVVRRGDPQSEFMKFLAGSKAFQAIVWGGEQDLIDKKAPRQKTHWLVKMKDKLECPVVVPSMKS